jgi:2-aminoethylphosphonate-pyruvate transaminase
MKQHWLMNPGPVNVPDAVRDASLGPDLCHREPEATELMARVRSGLLAAAGVGDPWRVVLIAGSGTAAVEMAVSSLVRPGKKLLVVRNGVYGDRMAQMAEAHGIARVELETPWTERADPSAVDAALEADPEIDAVALVHHETTTGLINPIRAIGELCRRHGALLILDTVSGFAGEPLELDAWGIGAAASTANKCLHARPGVAFVFLSALAQQRLAETRPRSVYLDLAAYMRAEERATVPFTPCIPGLQSLEAALGVLAAEGGIEARIATYRRRAAILRDGLSDAGLRMLLPEPLRSTCITAFDLPAGISYVTLHDRLKERGYVVYAGQGPLADRVFRIANMGAVPDTVYERFVDDVRAILAS